MWQLLLAGKRCVAQLHATIISASFLQPLVAWMSVIQLFPPEGRPAYVSACVLLQLPMYNEEAHCEVVIERACNIIWPRERIIIQVRWQQKHNFQTSIEVACKGCKGFCFLELCSPAVPCCKTLQHCNHKW
jgi:hypothetical protein